MFSAASTSIPCRTYRARWDRVVDTRLCTVIGNEFGATVGTIEHLMAALAGMAIDNVIVEVDGPEVPIMDGSAAPFVFLIECAGIRQQDSARKAIRICKPVTVEDGDKRVTFRPASEESVRRRDRFRRLIHRAAATFDGAGRRIRSSRKSPKRGPSASCMKSTPCAALASPAAGRWKMPS